MSFGNRRTESKSKAVANKPFGSAEFDVAAATDPDWISQQANDMNKEVETAVKALTSVLGVPFALQSRELTKEVLSAALAVLVARGYVGP